MESCVLASDLCYDEERRRSRAGGPCRGRGGGASLPAEEQSSEPDPGDRHRPSKVSGVMTRSSDCRAPEARAGLREASQPAEERSSEPNLHQQCERRSGAGRAPEARTVAAGAASLPVEERNSEPDPGERRRSSDVSGMTTRSGAGRAPKALAGTSATSVPVEERSIEPESGMRQSPSEASGMTTSSGAGRAPEDHAETSATSLPASLPARKLPYQLRSIKVLHRENIIPTTKLCKIMESLYIRQLKPALNRNIDSWFVL